MSHTGSRTGACLAVVVVLLVNAGPALAGGAIPTSCNDLCSPTADPCVVSTPITVVKGSTVDCGARAVHVSGGALLVHDGLFVLKAGSLLVTSGGRIESDCPAETAHHGFTVRVGGTITLPDGGGGKLAARCEAGGGRITLTAAGAVTIGALGIDASSTAADGPGGNIAIVTTGNVATTAELRANAFGGDAVGGNVSIRGDDISLGHGIKARGSGSADDDPGGAILVDASGDLSITGSGFELDAGTAQGDGGDIALHAGDTFSSTRPLKAQGTGSTSDGGSVEIAAETIELDGLINVTGGAQGGSIRLSASRGPVRIGTHATGAFALDAGGNQSTGGGGDIRIESRGGDVQLTGSTQVFAKNNTAGGEGGTIVLDGVAITTAPATEIDARGTTGQGGSIDVRARDGLSLLGAMTALYGDILIEYRAGTPTLTGVVPPYTVRQVASLPAPCGDGIQRLGVEICDAPDLAAGTCASQGYSGGALGCSSNCLAFDTSGCN